METKKLFASGFTTGFGSAFLQFLFERFATIGSIGWKKIGIIWGVEEELRKLQRTFLKIQDLVDRMESSGLRFSSGNKAWKMWYDDLRKLAYDADALLDHVSLLICSGSSSGDEDEDEQVRSKILYSFQLSLPDKVIEMQKKLEGLVKEMESLFLIEKVGLFDFRKIAEKSVSGASSVNMNSLLVDEKTIVGRKDDRQKVVQFVCEGDDVSVIPVVGMGGIGKTTLALLVYNDLTIRNKFGDRRVWISLSVELDLREIMRDIIESVTKKSCKLSNLNSLQLKLQEVLTTCENVLIVLDDYWSEIGEEWKFLFATIMSGCNRSKIIVTTRSMRVAAMVGTTEGHQLQRLTVGDWWRVVEQRVSLTDDERQNLGTVMEETAEKCEGLPSAAKAIGDLLHAESNKDKWDSILKNELWESPQGLNGIFLPLMLSYVYLPMPLKRCFAYCSIFPKNHEFRVEELVLLWMAEGFVHPVGEAKAEDIGKDYFSDLFMKSFFLLQGNSPDQTTFKMHSLIHDLARLVSSDTCAQVKHEISHPYSLFGDACHMSLHHDNVQPLELRASHRNERLRTFLVICKPRNGNGVIDRELFSNLKFVKVLDLSYIRFVILPESILELIYLRYLNLSGNLLSSLPESMSKLLALQTLKLLNNINFKAWSRDMNNLCNLRHLHFDIDGNLTCMPTDIGKLTNLQTLSGFILSKRKGCHIDELKDMNSLRGSLCIKNLHFVRDSIEAMDAKLEDKVLLDKLTLAWEPMNVLTTSQAQIFETLKPHGNLKEIKIMNYSGKRYPSWLSSSARKFTRIHLEGLSYCTTLPCLGELPHLKFLFIKEMDGLTTIDHSFYGSGSSIKFQSLESVELHHMTELINWTDQANNSMPNVTVCILHDCPKLATLPPSLEMYRIASRNRGCYSL